MTGGDSVNIFYIIVSLIIPLTILILGIYLGAQLLVMILAVIPTEIALRKHFDEQGKLK